MAKSLAEQVLPKSVIDGIRRLTDPHLKYRANGRGLCSAKMQSERSQFFLLMVAQLWEMDFRIRKLQNLSGKHVQALMTSWHKEGICAGTLHTRLSMIRVLCEWMGKANLVKDISDYLPSEAVRRNTVAKESKAWEDKGVDPLEIIERAEQIDERLAIMLALQHHFGLRVKESIEIRPLDAVIENGKLLEIREGTKGGRLRWVRIDSPEQVELINLARRIVDCGNPKRLRWPGRTWKQARNRFYNWARRLGISGEGLGVTAHGLRHGFAQRTYEKESGFPSPIKGGALGKIDREKHRMASTTVSNALGHGRVDVTSSYYGSYGHALRETKPVSMTYKLQFGAQRQPGAESASESESGETP